MFPVLFLVPRPPTSCPPLRVWGGLSWESCKSVPGCYGDIEDTCSQSKASTYTCAFKITSGYTQERISSFSLVKQISFLHSHAPLPTVTSLHAVCIFYSHNSRIFATAQRASRPSHCGERRWTRQLFTPTFSPRLRQPLRKFRVCSGTRSALLGHHEWKLKTTPPLKMAL